MHRLENSQTFLYSQLRVVWSLPNWEWQFTYSSWLTSYPLQAGQIKGMSTHESSLCKKHSLTWSEDHIISECFQFVSCTKFLSSCCVLLFLEAAQRRPRRISYALTDCKSADSSSIPIIPFDSLRLLRASPKLQSDLYYTIFTLKIPLNTGSRASPTRPSRTPWGK